MRESRAPVTLVALALGLVVACSGSAQPGRAPARSPSLDYPAPAQESSQGEVVGADRIPPGDKLRQGARVGPGGVTPAEGPATSAPKGPTSEPQTLPGTSVPIKAVPGTEPQAEPKGGSGSKSK